jgi:uncharacterized repeat protein (TIGR03803 family)
MKKMLLICLCLFAIGKTAKTQNQVFWGLTPMGGQYGGGTIFTINNNGTGFNVVHHFQSPAGYTPYGSLMQAGNGKLYGTCFNGGSFASCTIFRFDPSTNSYTDVYDFDITHGDFPMSGLVEDANGKLYGAATAGGSGFSGVIYSLDPSTNIYTDEFDLINATGASPIGCPVNINGVLYGLASMGGANNNNGTIYSYNISTDTYTDLYDFSAATGAQPNGSLIHLSNGKFYGLTQAGGASGNGVIFSFDPVTNMYSTLFSFSGSNGSNPSGSLFAANNGLLYGTTSTGGPGNYGTLFSFNPANNSFVKLVDFNLSNGATPSGELRQGSNGLLYGSTQAGGSSGQGLMYSYDITTSTLTSLFNFDITTGYGSTGGFSVVTSTGIETANTGGSSITFYPNPVSDHLTIYLETDKAHKAEINIMNATGKLIYSVAENNLNPFYRKTIDMSKFESGIYFLECILDGDKTLTKLAKQ